MALEVGRLVARIDIEGSFEQKLTAAKTAMEDAAKSAGRFDDAMSKAGQSGAKLKVSDEPKRKIDDAAKSATKLDDGLSKASEAGKRLDVSNDARRKLDDTATSAGKTATSLDKASASGKNMQVSDQPRQKLSETASVADQVNTKFAGLGVTMKQVVGMAGGAAGLGAVLTKGWDRITAIDTAQGKLRGLGHEAEGVSTIMSSALDSVTGTSYGLGDAATIAANAVAAGIQPGKDLTKYLTMTADASAIAGVSLGEMGRILNQVQTGQSAYAGDLSQLADRGIPIYQWLADEAGVAAEEIKGMASTGQISSQMLFNAIQNNIGGAAQELGSTLTGSLANVGAAFGRLGASAIDPFKATILDAASGATDFADALSSGIGPAASVAASALSGVAKVIGTIPTPILAATAGLVALQKTGLGASMAGAATTAVGALKGVGETIALNAMYAGDNIRANGLFAASMDGVKGAAGGMKAGLGNIVNMLGGPWMIAATGAALVIGDLISSAMAARAAHDEIAESAARATSAHRELALAVGEANGAMSDTAVAAAQSIIEEKITATNAAIGLAEGGTKSLANWVDDLFWSYDDLSGAVDNANNTWDRNRWEGRANEMQMAALKDAAGDLNIEMDHVSAIVQEGGPRWKALRDAMATVGPEGVDMANKLQEAADAAERTAEAARRAEPGSIQLAEAFRVMGDEASSAADKAAALDAALIALAGPTYDADEAMANYWRTARKTNEELDSLISSGDGLGIVMRDGALAFDLQSEAGDRTREMFKDMRSATAEVVASGGDLTAVLSENERRMQQMAAESGHTVEELEALAETTGYFTDPIELALHMVGGDQAAAELAMVAQTLKDVPKGETIEVRVESEDAIEYLRSVGWEVEELEDGNIKVTASTEDARAGLENVAKIAGEVDGTDVSVKANADVTDAETKIANIFYELSELDEAEANPELGLVIDQFMQGRDISHAELDELHSRVVDPQARLLIEQLLRESARANADLDNTARPRTATITPQLAAGSLGSIQSSLNSMSFTVPVRALPTLPNANGGIWSFADGGMTPRGSLPGSARIERPHGAAGIVQWAEAETGGEAFIPLAASKRQRSRKIWAATGKLLGIDVGDIAKFANGGFTATKALTGTPYIWGGFSPAGVDCSGLMSVAANEATGRAPYSERTSTHTMGSFLASRGFVRGMGGAGDLRIGWDNGHTAGTAPDGTKFESQTYGRGAVWGGNSRGHDLAQFNQHMHLPMGDAATDGLAGDDGTPYVDNRTPRQKNIDAIVQEGQRRGLSDRDIQVALMTAEQESGIRVLANPADAASMNMAHEGVGYDHDSTGIFQQRNNGAWGTLEDRMDPTKSAGMFYDELEKIEGRDQMALTAVAQKVQRSAYPDAYAKHEGKASEELAASKARLESLSRTGSGGGEGQKVFVTNWPSGGGSYTRSGGPDAISDAKDAVEDAQKAAFVQDQSIAAMVARAAGRSDLIQVEKFANGGFHGLENHTAHIAPAGSWRVFGEPETGGEAYIPLASHKRARSTAILAETARRMGYTLGAGVNLVGSVLTGNGLDTGWGGPSLSDLGIDTGALRDSLSPGVTAEAERAGQQIAAILQQLGTAVDQQVEGTLSQVNDGQRHLRQQYARAMI